MNGIELIAVCLLLGTACWTDIRSLTIPNLITLSFASAGLLYELLAYGLNGLGMAAVGAIAGMLPLAVLYRLRGIGGGDVKWFGACGVWLGAWQTWELLIYSILYAGAFAGVILLLKIPALKACGKRLPWPWGIHPAQGGALFPFMIAVVPAFITLLAIGA
jgi:prepilin peptidase CpaA